MRSGGIDLEAAWRAHLARLLPILAGIAALLPDGALRVPRFVRLRALSTLLAAESIARRIIATASAGVRVEPPAPGEGTASPKRRKTMRRARKRAAVPAFPLFDPRKKIGPPEAKKTVGYGPNIRGLDGTDPAPPPPPLAPRPEDEVSIASLRRRLASVLAAMGDVEGQAARLARVLASGRSRYKVPMRVGRPPGHRARVLTARGHHRKGWRAVDELLFDANWFAWRAFAPP